MNHEYVPEVSSEKLLLSRPIRCELSRLRCHGHSLLLSSYLHRISRKENSACSACEHPLQDLNHLLLDCSASEPLRKSIFGSSLSLPLFLICGPDLGVWPDCWVSAEFLRAPIPRKRSGSTTTIKWSNCWSWRFSTVLASKKSAFSTVANPKNNSCSNTAQSFENS